MKCIVFFTLFLGLVACEQTSIHYVYESDTLKVHQLSENTFQHISYLDTKSYGKVACNGLLILNDGKSMVIDTPTDDKVSNELIDWLESHMKTEVIGVVVTHFHVDCLGGLGAFHEKQVPSYANSRTIHMVKQDSAKSCPQNGFDQDLVLEIGPTALHLEYYGEGHTRDNITVYYPSEGVLFGGCLIKSKGASKGNLADANIQEWSNTVNSLRDKRGDAKIVVPGHGKAGDQTLLDYTYKLFKY